MATMTHKDKVCFSLLFTHIAHQSQPSLTTDHWPLTTAFLGGRAYSALPCAGAPPPQRPPYCSRRSECVANMTLSTRGDRASTPTPRLGRFRLRACVRRPGDASSRWTQGAPLRLSRARYRNRGSTCRPGRPHTGYGLVVTVKLQSRRALHAAHTSDGNPHVR